MSCFLVQLTVLVPGILAVYCVAYIWRQYQIRSSERRGDGVPPSLPSKDPLFGIDVYLQINKAHKQGRRSKVFKEQHDALGPTFESVTKGKGRVFSMDPANLQTICSSKFAEWGVAPLRLEHWGALIGPGVMDTDGQYWKHSRGILQPLFRREQVLNVSAFDVHLERLLGHLPPDGSTVGLQPLFVQLALDFSTEFLLSVSVASLSSGPNEEASRFLKAFHQASAGVGRRTQLLGWAAMPWDRSF